MAAPMPAITPQPSSPAAVAGAAGSTFVHCPAATSVLSANAPMPSAGDSSVPSVQRHLLRGVVGGEAVPRLAAAARPALAAHGPPVEDHEVAGRHVGDARRRPPRPMPAASWPSRNGKSSLMPPSR